MIDPRIDRVNNTLFCFQISINSAKSEDQLLCRGRPLRVDLTKVSEIEFLLVPGCQCWGSGIHMFLGLPDPEVGGTDPGPDPSLFSKRC